MGKYNEDEISRYILERLPPNEKIKFEEEMQNDTEFKQEVQLQLQITEALQYQRSLEAKIYLKKSVQNWRQYVPKLNRSGLAQKAQQGVEDLVKDLNNLVLQFFNPYSAAFRNPVVEQLSIEDQAFYYYNRQDYIKAIHFLQKLPKEDQEVQLMIGNAYIGLKDYETAYPYFKQIIKDEAVFFLNDAHWFGGLCSIGANQINEAKNHFNYLINDENTAIELQQNAQTILNKLTQRL